ncbi:MAG: hypothetical protein E7406_03245 [Ruminococcaceae bacterium]|nr:hypothetical protein [Oscillospiraceae bacterium]
MSFLKSKRFQALITALFFVILYIRHEYNISQEFYLVGYEKTDISSLIRNEELTDKDYDTIFKNTGVSPKSAEKFIEDGNYGVLDELNDLYFKKPEIERVFVAHPVTVGERNAKQITPVVDLKNGDVLVTFNTHTLDWRHGHCALVIDAEKGILLEHMSIGNPSCLTSVDGWGRYPGFVVLRYPDEKVAQEAVNYAVEHLIGIDYNILAGVIKKDKSDEKIPESSHCSHIVWQAYKAVGVDIDETGGIFVTPENIAMSEKLDVLQIYGLNPKDYKSRLAK